MALVNDSDCRYCGKESVYMDVKEEPTLYKVGAQCVECSHDYGVVKRISRSEIDRVDDVYELGEDRVKQLLDGK